MTMQFLRLFTFMLKYCQNNKPNFQQYSFFSFNMSFVIYSYKQTIKFNIDNSMYTHKIWAQSINIQRIILTKTNIKLRKVFFYWPPCS